MSISYAISPVALILALIPLHCAERTGHLCKEISALEHLSYLLSGDSPDAPLLRAVAERSNSTDSELAVKIRKMETQLGLIMAELEADLLATTEAQKFLTRAAAYGLPSFDNLRFYDHHVVSYDNRLKQPVWTLEYYWCRKVCNYAPVMRKKYFYFPDLSVPPCFRSTDEDYKSSEYYRGHFATAFDNEKSPNLLTQSFTSSNVAPMVHNLHRAGCLWHRLESYATFIARRSKNTHIVTGVLYLPADGTLSARDQPKEKVRYRTIGLNRVAVPSHFYKILLHETKAGSMSLEAFVVPNSPGVDEQTLLERFRINVHTELPKIEALTGLRFFELLDRQNLLLPDKFKYGYTDRPPKTLEYNFPAPQHYVMMK